MAVSPTQETFEICIKKNPYQWRLALERSFTVHTCTCFLNISYCLVLNLWHLSINKLGEIKTNLWRAIIWQGERVIGMWYLTPHGREWVFQRTLALFYLDQNHGGNCKDQRNMTLGKMKKNGLKKLHAAFEATILNFVINICVSKYVQTLFLSHKLVFSQSIFPRTSQLQGNLIAYQDPNHVYLRHPRTSVYCYPWSTFPLTIVWHFNHYSVDNRSTSQSTVSLESTNFHRHTIECWLIHLSQLTLSQLLTACQSSVNQDVDWASIEIWIDCQGFWSPLNCGCL